MTEATYYPLTGNADPCNCLLRKKWRVRAPCPRLLSGSSGMLPEVRVPFFKISIDRCLRVIECLVVTVMDDRASHSAEDGFNHVEELSTRRQWNGLDDRSSAASGNCIVSSD